MYRIFTRFDHPMIPKSLSNEQNRLFLTPIGIPRMIFDRDVSFILSGNILVNINRVMEVEPWLASFYQSTKFGFVFVTSIIESNL